MGIKGAHSYTHSLSGVSIGEIYQIALTIRKKNNQLFSFDDNVNIPTIDIDASWIYRSSSISIDNRLNWMINLLLEFVQIGFIVVLVCDNDLRHHSKVATISRKAKYEKSTVEGYVKRTELMKLARKREESVSVDEISKISALENSLSNKIKALEKQHQSLNIDVGNEFYNGIQIAINNLTVSQIGNRNGKMLVIKAKFQADTVLAYRCKYGISDIVFSSDSDLAALAGDRCIGIKSFKYNDRSKVSEKISDMVIYTCATETLYDVTKSIHIPSTDQRIKISNFPIFENIHDIKIRGLLAIGLGCDVYLTGIHQLGKVQLKKFCGNKNNLTYNNLINYYYEHALKFHNNNLKRKTNNNIDDNFADNIIDTTKEFNLENFIDAINIYLQALIYEPCNYFSNTITNDITIYMTDDFPRKLHEYVKCFANNNLQIEIYTSNNKLGQCIGTGKGEHTFLCYEDHYKCDYCNNTICKYCSICTFNVHYCSECYLSEIAVIPKNIMDQPTIYTMRKLLEKIGIATHIDDSVGDITDLYEAAYEYKEKYAYTDLNNINEINIPLYPTTYLNTEKILYRFDLKEGGSFIRHSLCTINHKYQLICLLSKLVETGEINYNEVNSKFYTILPDLIVNFAERSRIHSGYRLLKRAVRHAMDSESCNIMNSHCCVIDHNGTTGLHINHNIKASMKACTYEIRVSFTCNDILAVSCTCKAGSTSNEKIICVHILPVILQLSLLLFDGLSEHLLCELATDLKEIDINESLSIEEIKNLKKALIVLKRSNSDIDNSNIYNNDSISVILNKYNVGTESYKRGPGPPLDIYKLGPLRDMSLISPLNRAKIIMNTNKIDLDTKVKKISQFENIIDKTVPYKLLDYLIMFIENYFKNKTIDNKISNNTCINECIGFRVLKIRSKKGEELNQKRISRYKKKLIDALNEANRTYRNNDIITNKTIYVPQNLVDNDNNNPVDEINTNNNNEPTNNIVSKIIRNNSYKIKRRTCCACNVTTTTSPNMVFTSIPKVVINEINENSTNVMLETYHRKRQIRREWMIRLGLAANNPKNYLQICDNHELEIQLFQYKWKNKNGIEILTKKKAKLAVQQNEPPLKTRQQHQTRTTFSNNFIPNKKRKQNNEVSTCETNNVNNEIIKPKTSKKITQYCAFLGCTMNNSSKQPGNIKFCRVPTSPLPFKDSFRNCQRLQHAKRKEYKKLFFKIIGVDINDSRSDIRICNQHEQQTVSTSVNWFDIKNVKQSTKVIFNLPAVPLSKDKCIRESKGLGIDRYLCKEINKAKEQKDSEWVMTLQQTIAMTDGTDNVHHSVAKAAGIDIHIQNDDIKYKINNENINKKKELTVVRLIDLTDETIKQQTGFRTKANMISYILIVCNGCIDTMIFNKTIKSISKLTWFESWYFFLERVYSKTYTRWKDYESKYERSEQYLRLLYDEKLRLVVKCRQRWPKYVTLQEDEIMRKETWNTTYEGKRVIMWDNTNIKLPKPLDPDAQRNTYSAYYAGNVGKGAIFVQLCGWMGTHELWMGAVSDTDYFIRSGILQQQVSYVTEYDPSTINIPWMNILDRGYRVTGAAWRAGKQFVLQPTFAKSDTKFTTTETIRSAAIASDRGGNERAVRLSKMSAQLHNGALGNQSMERLSDLWLTWSFQCNFIYKPVL